MQLLKFRVTEFRSVLDSGWIDVESITALIGTNESGKTNILLPLWKLNPADDGAINLQDDLQASHASLGNQRGIFCAESDDGARAINAIELHKISEYLQVSMDSLMKMPEKPMDTSVIHSFMGRVKTEEARKGIQLADELSDMILFHSRVCENGKKMEQPWEDK